jgi:hypothetical protein
MGLTREGLGDCGDGKELGKLEMWGRGVRRSQEIKAGGVLREEETGTDSSWRIVRALGLTIWSWYVTRMECMS